MTQGTGVQGTVTDIQRCSVHDGPGIRTTVFLKGCPLACPWCHNPEAQRPAPEILFDEARCLGCGECRRACGLGPRDGEAGRGPDRERCAGCGRCAEACPTLARLLCGRRMTAEAVAEAVARDREFYATSGGGVTLSGGEPALQPDFAAALLAACRERGISTAVQTTGWCPPESLLALLQHTDLLLLDLKTLDPEAHRRVLGRPLGPVLASGRLAAGTGIPLVVRVPLVPGFNDDDRSLRGILEFAAELTERVAFVPYHRLGEGKYRRLGRPVPTAGTPEPSPEGLQRAATLAAALGLGVVG